MNTILLVLGCAALMLLAEQLAPGRRWQRTPYWWLRVIGFNLAQALMVLIAGLSWDRWLPGLALWDAQALGTAGGALAGYLAITFVYYWWHRARHESPLLWRWLHQLHHSPQRIEVVTSFYKHPLEMLCNGILSSTVLYVVMGLGMEAAALAVLTTGVAELFYHWNVRTPYWLGFIIQRPESHCVHHQRSRHHGNYSDLPLWDILFGTFHNPRGARPDCGFADGEELRLREMLLGHDLHRSRS